MTKREQAKRPRFSRASVRENAVGERRRLLADRADFAAGSIFLFENRDPEGDFVVASPRELSETEQAGRFANKYGRRLRGLFHDLKAEDLVGEEDLPLFYWPQSAEARIRLALRLRDVALTARRLD